MKWGIGGGGYFLSMVSLYMAEDLQTCIYSGILMSIIGFLLARELDNG